MELPKWPARLYISCGKPQLIINLVLWRRRSVCQTGYSLVLTIMLCWSQLYATRARHGMYAMESRDKPPIVCPCRKHNGKMERLVAGAKDIEAIRRLSLGNLNTSQ